MNDIKLEKKEGRATITFDNPQKFNALSHETMWRLAELIKDVSEDESIRVLILTGSGNRAFAAGADINKMEEMTAVQLIHELPLIQDVVASLEKLTKPVIARINGIALGGGMEIALACDFRIAAENAVFGLPEVKLGIIPGYGGTQRLPRIVGIAKAKEILFLGNKINAVEALQIGLINRVVPYEQLDTTVENLADQLLAMPPLSLRFLKEAVYYGMQMDIDSAIRMEARLFTNCFGSEDRIEGVRAFLGKRKPLFRGR
jgi:enoyl-CoA hydratase